jgi:hypothetical protein
MKLRHSLLGVGLLLMGAGLTPAVAETFRPERGVRCDDVEQICYYRGSPSVEMTRQYFGRDAARALRWNLRREEPRRPERVFYPEPGVRCDRAEQVCFNRRGEFPADPRPSGLRRRPSPGAAARPGLGSAQPVTQSGAAS